MAKDYKYKDSTPVDEPVRKGTKVQEPGSGIRVAPEKYDYEDVNETMISNSDGAETAVNLKSEKPQAGNRTGAGMSRYIGPNASKAGAGRGSVNPKRVDTYSKGGTASARADGIAQRGKTRGTIAAMCGGGMSRGKR
jgi:hypothetical protein